MAQPTMATYVSDMLAVQQHLLGPVEHQVNDAEMAKYPEAKQVVTAAHEYIASHIKELESRLEALGGHPTAGVKSAVAQTLGAAATAIGNVRKTEISKYLRDDYASFSFAAASYTALEATALGMSDAQTADLAKRHMADVATSIMRLSRVLPLTVLTELQNEGAAVDASVVSKAQADVKQAWTDGRDRSAASVN